MHSQARHVLVTVALWTLLRPANAAPSAPAADLKSTIVRLEALTSRLCRYDVSANNLIPPLGGPAPKSLASTPEYWTALSAACLRAHSQTLAELILAIGARVTNSPDLLLARARLSPQSLSLDLLSENGWSVLDREASTVVRELLELRIGVPGVWSKHFFVRWIDALLDHDRLERAAEVAQEAIGRFPGDARVLSRQAMLLALRGVDSGYEEVEALNARDAQTECKYIGVADCFLAAGRADLAVRSLKVERSLRPKLRRLLAVAYAHMGESSTSFELLADSGLPDELLRIRVALMAGRLDKAREVGHVVADRAARQLAGGAPWLRSNGDAYSIQSEYVAAAAWLLAEFPAKRTALAHYVGDPSGQGMRREAAELVIPSSELIRRLKAEMDASTEPSAVLRTKSKLAQVYAVSRQYAAAASEIAPLVFASTIRGEKPHASVGFEAVNWSNWTRYAELDELSRIQPAKIIELAHFLIATSDRFDDSATGVRSEKVKELSCGRGALAAFAEADPRLTCFATAFELLADWQDVPVLIQALEFASPHLNGARVADAVQQDRIHRCLCKITHQEYNGAPSGRRDFWVAWWHRHAPRLFRSSDKTH